MKFLCKYLIFLPLLLGCGLFESKPKTRIPITIPPAPEPPPEQTCNGKPLGSTRIDECPSGQEGNVLMVCTKSGWNEAQRTCTIECDPELSNKVNFNGDIQPILQRSCVNCHSVPERFDDYGVAKRLVNDYIYRIGLRASNLQRMPRPPAPQLSVAEKGLISQWLEDGLLETDGCNDRDDTGSEWKLLDLNYLESNILQDLQRLDNQSKELVGYVTLTHKYNRWASKEEMEAFRNGIDKSVNSLSTERDLLKTDAIDARQTIYRIDLEAYGFTKDSKWDTRDDWDAVTDADEFKFESFTSEGLQIKQLTGRDRVWMHADNYNFVAHGNADIYYETLNIAADLFTFLNDQGVNLQQEFDNFDVILAGFFGSPISQNKNRMISRNENAEGYMWITYDPNSVFEDDKNYFEFPLLEETGGLKVANFDASEIIYTLPNGLQGYALFNANNVRENEAPIDVVTDINSPFSPVISNAISCHRCHNQGLLVTQDQIRDSVLANASEFDPDDVERVRAFYPSNAALAATFTSDIREFRASMNKIGLSIGQPDPINQLTDDFRRDYNLRDVSGFVFFSPEQMEECINSSSALKAQIGQLLNTNGTVGLVQFTTSFPNIVRDCRLGQDPING